MLIYCSNLVKYDTRPVRDVDILQYFGKIRQPSSQGCCSIAVLWLNTTPVQSGMLIYCSIMVNTAPVQSGMLFYRSIMVKYDTRPVRDVVILQYYGKIRHPSRQGCCSIAVLWLNTAPVQSGMLIYCSIMVKYDIRPVRDVVILHEYGKIRHPSSQGCCYNAILW